MLYIKNVYQYKLIMCIIVQISNEDKYIFDILYLYIIYIYHCFSDQWFLSVLYLKVLMLYLQGYEYYLNFLLFIT